MNLGSRWMEQMVPALHYRAGLVLQPHVAVCLLRCMLGGVAGEGCSAAAGAASSPLHAGLVGI